MAVQKTSVRKTLLSNISHVSRPIPTVSCSAPHTSETIFFEAVIMPLNSPSRNLGPEGNGVDLFSLNWSLRLRTQHDLCCRAVDGS